jgi:hypothetical protein
VADHDGFAGGPAIQGDQVHPEGDLLRFKPDTHAGGFERRPHGVVEFRVISEQREIGHIAPWIHAVGDGSGKPYSA